MAIGKMREVVDFQVNQPFAVGAGWEDNYVNLLTTRGELRNDSGNRSLSFGEIVDTDSLTLIVRFQNNLANNLRTDTKIIIDSITYTFSSYKLIDQRKHLYEFKIKCQQQ